MRLGCDVLKVHFALQRAQSRSFLRASTEGNSSTGAEAATRFLYGPPLKKNFWNFAEIRERYPRGRTPKIVKFLIPLLSARRAFRSKAVA
jgi:hypothetical protein